MSSSIGPGRDARHGEELVRLRRRLVADGYSTPHSCEHCDELTIFFYNPNDRQRGIGTPTVTSREEMRQRTAHGCRLWSLVSDEVDYEILKCKRKGDAGMQDS